MTKSSAALRRNAEVAEAEAARQPPQPKLARPARKRRMTKKGRAKKAKTKRSRKPPSFTPLEERAARGLRIRVEEAEPDGWFAHSETGGEPYYLFVDPETRRLQCTCADACYRGDQLKNRCKHTIAVLLHIAQTYLEQEYDPRRPRRTA